ncbi:hypothetical protein AURDEDRAFT_159293 [Auricularia subglabra TFB-10046 SS5]|nr:hypothetical protein AURDEDRAFT_159293 [Auricularia subglabra TFB-10046 SS5]
MRTGLLVSFLAFATGALALTTEIKRLNVDRDHVVRDVLTVRDANGLEHTLLKKSPAEASIMFGRACQICDDRGCGCCGVPPGGRPGC